MSQSAQTARNGSRRFPDALSANAGFFLHLASSALVRNLVRDAVGLVIPDTVPAYIPPPKYSGVRPTPKRRVKRRRLPSETVPHCQPHPRRRPFPAPNHTTHKSPLGIGSPLVVPVLFPRPPQLACAAANRDYCPGGSAAAFAQAMPMTSRSAGREARTRGRATLRPARVSCHEPLVPARLSSSSTRHGAGCGHLTTFPRIATVPR